MNFKNNIMKTKILLFITIGLLLFTISAFSLAMLNKDALLFTFGIMGFFLLMTFKNYLKTAN